MRANTWSPEDMDSRPRWQGANGHIFRERARYNPNEEDDLWIEYENELTKQIYTCRLEAFLARFGRLPG